MAENAVSSAVEAPQLQSVRTASLGYSRSTRALCDPNPTSDLAEVHNVSMSHVQRQLSHGPDEPLGRPSLGDCPSGTGLETESILRRQRAGTGTERQVIKWPTTAAKDVGA